MVVESSLEKNFRGRAKPHDMNGWNCLNNWNRPQLFCVLGKTKTNVAATGGGVATEPVRRAQELRSVAPGTASQHALAAFVGAHTLEQPKLPYPMLSRESSGVLYNEGRRPFKVQCSKFKDLP